MSERKHSPSGECSSRPVSALQGDDGGDNVSLPLSGSRYHRYVKQKQHIVHCRGALYSQCNLHYYMLADVQLHLLRYPWVKWAASGIDIFTALILHFTLSDIRTLLITYQRQQPSDPRSLTWTLHSTRPDRGHNATTVQRDATVRVVQAVQRYLNTNESSHRDHA